MIVMCPNKKLKWFEDHGWALEAVEEVRQLVVKRWEESYKPAGTVPATTPVSAQPPVVNPLLFLYYFVTYTDIYSLQPGSRWKVPARQPSVVHPPNSIENYLASPVIDTNEVKHMGGIMMYWFRREQSCPDLLRYSSDYCSAPGS
jgi:hypothetical protein